MSAATCKKNHNNLPIQIVSGKRWQSQEKSYSWASAIFINVCRILPVCMRAYIKICFAYCPVSAENKLYFIGQCTLCPAAKGCPGSGVQRTQVGEVRIIVIRPARHTVADFYLQFKICFLPIVFRRPVQ